VVAKILQRIGIVRLMDEATDSSFSAPYISEEMIEVLGKGKGKPKLDIEGRF
jgi:hypothetical protein